MRIIPVIDVKGGAVVRGVAGRRDEYQPLVSRLSPASDPAELAAALVDEFGFEVGYLADLDAIAGQAPRPELLHRAHAAGLSLIADVGLRSERAAVEFARQVGDVAAGIVVGLESSPSPRELVRMRRALPSDLAVFSLDLQGGQPMTAADEWRGWSAVAIAAAAAEAGFQRWIVLDLADVGVDRGTSTRSLLRELNEKFPDIEMLAGGGVRSGDDLRQLAACGVRGALVASALHAGAITPALAATYRCAPDAVSIQPPPSRRSPA